MTCSFIILIFALTAALAACLAIADVGTTLLLFQLLFIPSVTAVINRAHSPKIDLKLSFPPQCEKNEAVSGFVRLTNNSFAGYRRVCICLKIKNKLTQETVKQTVKTSLTAKELSNVAVSFKAENCGNVEIICEEIRLYDFFGLTFRKFTADEFCIVTVLPCLFSTEVTLKNQGGEEICESYAPDRAGFDLSEVFEFADYALGDSPNRIQWKLSQKHERLIVRKGSFPLEKSVVLIMSPTFSNPARISAVAEVAVSVGQSFCESGIKFEIMIWEKERFETYEIEGEGDLAALLPKLLSVSPHGEIPSETRLSGAKHKVCVTDELRKAASLSEMNVTVLLADGESQERIIGFSSQNPSEALFEIEI